MPSVSWRGPAASPEEVRRLAAAGFTIAAGAGERGGLAVVVTAAGGRAPEAPGGGARWLWLSRAEVPPAAAAEAVRRGAYDVLSTARAGEAEQLAQRLAELAVEDSGPPPTPGVIAESPAARRALDQAWRAARSSIPVLLTGETGTGKEVMAGLVHRWSGRAGSYVPINCAAIPNELMESELFGHIRGAFSGAVATVDGKLLAAQGGSVFLDEIDDTPLNIQNKLLRVLEDGQVTRVGESRPRRADFRLIAATNRDLLQLIGEGRFGRDFYERLAIVRIELPRLAERREDIPAFVRHFIARFYERQEVKQRVRDVSPRAVAALTEHGWPGNIRELRNVIYQALVYKRSGSELLLSDLRPLLERAGRAAAEAGAAMDGRALRAAIEAGTFNLRRTVRALETEALQLALERSGGHIGAAARALGEVGRGRSADPGGTVRAMMRRLGLSRAATGRTRG
jgi:DNA-binding NtrC family response regulator